MDKTNENTVWCICRKIDDGREMIMCENPQCVIEWFHFDCVGIRTTPLCKLYADPEPTINSNQNGHYTSSFIIKESKSIKI